MKWFEDGFYTDESAPSGAVTVTDDQWRNLLEGQASGKMIVSGSDGAPKLQTRPVKPLTVEQTQAARLQAYRAESDPLFLEWQFDKSATAEQIWRDKVTEIKERYPLP